MINQLKKALQANPMVHDYLINEVKTISHQAFFVMQKLETKRLVETNEYHVTVYHRFNLDQMDYLGSASFAISRKYSKLELALKIEEAIYAASLIKNKTFELVQGQKKQSWKEKPITDHPFEAIDAIASTFFAQSSDTIRFNALEVFHTQTTTHTVNSRKVDLTKTTYKIMVEAIPSYDGETQKVELSKFYHYKHLDLVIIQNDAKTALKDVEVRYLANRIEKRFRVDVILRDQEVAEFFENLISDYSYDQVYRQATDKVIGDAIQKDVLGEWLSIGLIPTSKADRFDRDGVILKPIEVVENGIIKNYYGSNQYAQYLNFEPSGIMDMIRVPKGKTAFSTMQKKPHLEIIALSGIQIDIYSGYIGGEVRLAVYFDGKHYRPVSGFSFSGNIDQSLSSLRLSKELTALSNYQGPKYLKLTNMEII
jgi:predicted Zn-dependent protease